MESKSNTPLIVAIIVIAIIAIVALFLYLGGGGMMGGTTGGMRQRGAITLKQRSRLAEKVQQSVGPASENGGSTFPASTGLHKGF